MRTKKFRAWDKNNKVWFDDISINGQTGKVENYKQPLKYQADGKRLTISWEDFEVVQFTGLLDKNGREIYEGDYCTAKFNSAKDGLLDIEGQVVESDFMWCLENDGQYWSINRPYDFEIIGNIYENPELLN